MFFRAFGFAVVKTPGFEETFNGATKEVLHRAPDFDTTEWKLRRTGSFAGLAHQLARLRSIEYNKRSAIGAVPKWLRGRSAKPLCNGSSPFGASKKNPSVWMNPLSGLLQQLRGSMAGCGPDRPLQNY